MSGKSGRLHSKGLAGRSPCAMWRLSRLPDENRLALCVGIAAWQCGEVHAHLGAARAVPEKPSGRLGWCSYEAGAESGPIEESERQCYLALLR
jgi:hypothetical protein